MSIAFSVVIGVARIMQGITRAFIWTIQGAGFSVGNIYAASPLPVILMVASNFFIVGFSFPGATKDVSQVTINDWAFWGITAGLSLLSIRPMLKLPLGEAGNDALTISMAFATCSLSLLQLITTIKVFVSTPSKTPIGSDLGFASKLLGVTPGIVSPLVLVGGDVNIGLGAFSLVDGFAVCALVIAAACES